MKIHLQHMLTIQFNRFVLSEVRTIFLSRSKNSITVLPSTGNGLLENPIQNS